MFSSLTELTLDIWVLKAVHMKSLNHFTHSINDGVPGSVLKLQRLKNNSQSKSRELYFIRWEFLGLQAHETALK